MASKTICIKEGVYRRLAGLRKDGESFSELLAKMIDVIEERENNHDVITREVFGAGRDDIPDVVLEEFGTVRNDIDAWFTVGDK